MDLSEKLSRRSKRFEEFIYGVTPVDDLSGMDKLRHWWIERHKIGNKEKALFYQLFSVLINAGVTTLQSLRILKDRAVNERFYRILSTVYYAVERGESLSKSMGEFSDVFTKTELGIIETGEAVGAMDCSLKRLAEQAERQAKVRQDLEAALVYPAIIGIVLVIAAIIMITFVIPELRTLYNENGLEINGLTSLFINSSEFFSTYWIVLAAFVGIAWTIFKIYVGSHDGRLKFDAFILGLPYFGDVVRNFNIAEFTSTLGVLIESGIPIQTALKITSRAITNSLYQFKILELVGRVQSGSKISEVLREVPWLFPDNVTQMIEIGEKSASLGDLSLKISKQYEEELRYKLKNINTIIGPVVIIIVAVFVVLFALAILLPIFNLTQSVGA